MGNLRVVLLLAVGAVIGGSAVGVFNVRTEGAPPSQVDQLSRGMLPVAVGQTHQHAGHGSIKKPPIEQLMHCPLAFAGVHIQWDKRSNAVTAYHYCQLHKYGWTQCVLYDSHAPDAKLIGVEYLVTDQVYRSMPPEEQVYWHPHDYEVDSGRADIGLARKDGPLLLVSLTQTGAEEAQTLQKVRTLWGKITHTWVKGDQYPEGPSKLFYAVTGKDGFVLPPGFHLPPELRKK